MKTRSIAACAALAAVLATGTASAQTLEIIDGNVAFGGSVNGVGGGTNFIPDNAFSLSGAGSTGTGGVEIDDVALDEEGEVAVGRFNMDVAQVGNRITLRLTIDFDTVETLPDDVDSFNLDFGANGDSFGTSDESSPIELAFNSPEPLAFTETNAGISGATLIGPEGFAPGMLESGTYMLTFGAGVNEALQPDSIDYTLEILIPEPASLGLLTLPMLALRRRR